ncbi:hypothetical protein [Muricauda aurantiaca]|uniref:hypothetical protein n=1 Tax=Flagellimonas maritima TaxID=1383885 RepID=UPI001EEFEE78|nr:hypothetical protein [Allomuricauda aurantiaca]
MNILLLTVEKVDELVTELSILEVEGEFLVLVSEVVSINSVKKVLTSVFANTVEQNIDMKIKTTA